MRSNSVTRRSRLSIDCGSILLRPHNPQPAGIAPKKPLGTVLNEWDHLSHGGRVSESKGSVVPIERIESRILLVRGHKVPLDADLAALYGVTTKRFNEQVRRNAARFPENFMSQLSLSEIDRLRSQFGPSSWGGRRYSPFAFTEQGVAMLSSVLRSEKAVHVNIEIMRTRAPAAAAFLSCRAGGQTGGAGEKIRRAVEGGLRCDTRADAPPGEGPASHRLRSVAEIGR